MKDLDKKINDRNAILEKNITKVVEQTELAVKHAIKIMEPHIPAINAFAQNLGHWFEKLTADFEPLLIKIAQTDWKAVQERLESMPARSREAMIRASHQGWFFNWQNSFHDVWELIDSLQNADNEEVDKILHTHFTKDMDWYAGELTKAFPHRANAIGAAINAHKNHNPEGYYLSTPVFIAQADGVLSEVTGIPSATDKSRNREERKGSVWAQDQIGDDQETKDLLYQLLNLHTMDFLKSKRTRDQESSDSGKVFDALNRHQVMHGEVSDYGTETNSLKAFSFLVFTGLHVPTMLNSARFLEEKTDN